MRTYIKDLAFHYQGNRSKMMQAIKRAEKVPQYKSKYDYITIIDDSYPKALLDLYDPPLILFYSGNLNLLKKDTVAIVGSRKASSYALNQTKLLVNQLKENYVIISGLALGIDVCAHKAALKYGTIAVLGNGLDCFYPKQNTAIQKEMMVNNLVMSEFPEMIRPKPYHFPIRNRIIAALAKNIFIMAAGNKSGTMHTANVALELNRCITCLAHRIDEIDGQGCNQLIQEGAMILTKKDGLFNI